VIPPYLMEIRIDKEADRSIYISQHVLFGSSLQVLSPPPSTPQRDEMVVACDLGSSFSDNLIAEKPRPTICHLPRAKLHRSRVPGWPKASRKRRSRRLFQAQTEAWDFSTIIGSSSVERQTPISRGPLWRFRQVCFL